MRKFAAVSLVFALFSTTGCVMTTHVARLGEKIAGGGPEVLTATTSDVDGSGAPVGVVALEAECRIAPGDTEGGPGARSYLLRRGAPTDDERRFAKQERLEIVSAYHAGSDPEHAVPEGLPDAVLLVEGRREKPEILVKRPGGWAPLGVKRYVHQPRTAGKPVLATFVTAVLLPPAIVGDLVTFPIQWMLAPAFRITPP